MTAPRPLALALVLGCLLHARGTVSIASGQTTFGASASSSGSPAFAGGSSNQQPPAPERFPPQGWPMPVGDQMPRTFVLADVIDVTPDGDHSDISWDAEGWHGGDYNRLWFKSEGEQSFTRAERSIDAQLLYGRFIKKHYDVQIGGGVQTATFQGRNVTRGQAVVGVEGFVPYRYDLETLLFISQDGDVSGRVTFLRDYLITQRVVLQPRVETNIAAQRVEEFSVGSGLNNIEVGVRLRYEIRREFGPYVGLSVPMEASSAPPTWFVRRAETPARCVSCSACARGTEVYNSAGWTDIQTWTRPYLDRERTHDERRADHG